MLTFAFQSTVFLQGLRSRRKPVSPATLSGWSFIVRKHILPVIGDLDLATFENGAMRKFIDHLCSLGLAPRTIRDVVLVVKNVIASATDENGNLLYPRTWNHQFLNAPPIEPREMPCPSAEAVSKAVQSAPTRWARLIAVLAGTGLRIGELAALRTFNDGKHSCVDGDVIHVRQSLWHGQDVSTKTASGVRDVYMCSTLAEIVAQHAHGRKGFLFSRDPLRPIAQASARKALAKYGIKGFHSLRRFRVTVLRAGGMPEPLIRAEIGHARVSITDLYDKSARNAALRRDWSERVGLGFDLPSRLLSGQDHLVLAPPKEVTQPVLI